MGKLKIFLAFFMVAITLVFMVQIVKFLEASFGSIDAKKKEFSCSKASFGVDMIKGTDKFALEVSSYNANISKITIIGNEGRKSYLFDSPISPGESRNLMVNMSPRKEYYFFINDCNNTGVKK